MFKVLTKNNLKYLEFRANSRQDIFNMLQSNKQVRELYENAIRNIPELDRVSKEMRQIKDQSELQKKSNEMMGLLVKYGLLMPASDGKEQQLPLDVFGPKGMRAIVIDSSIPPERVGIENNEIEKPSILTRITSRVGNMFSK